MYTNIQGIQILISLLKQNNIKHIVISPGTRNTPLSHSVEIDDFFECYSIVDERSAAFFALELSEKLDKPVCVTCTAATATCNYMPAIKEAYERNIQLVALTADQDDYSKFHMGDQNINQTNMFDRYVKYAVDVPKIRNEDDYWFFNRSVNEALNEINHHSKGPIQINFRMDYTLDELSYFPIKEIPKTRKINNYRDDINWDNLASKINDKKILIFCGSDYYKDETLKEQLQEFKKKTNCVILGDYYSNLIGNDFINPSIIAETYRGKNLEKLKPQLIILLGSVIYTPIKSNRELFSRNVETWEISSDGRLNDGFRNVSSIFECDTYEFFKNINTFIKAQSKENSFEEAWRNTISNIKLPNLDFTHMNAIKKFLEIIPDNSLLHMSVLDAIRISNYFKVPENVKCFANIGADGIDGALSTFLGQASKYNGLSFLLIGDLSLLYDLNGLYTNIPNNIRILVINNYAGAEFHKNFGLKRINTINRHIAAGHKTKMENVSKINKFQYLNAENDQELDKALDTFIKNSSNPILLEVITDANTDANKLKEFWKINENSNATIKHNVKKIIKRILPKKAIKIIKNVIKR